MESEERDHSLPFESIPAMKIGSRSKN